MESSDKVIRGIKYLGVTREGEFMSPIGGTNPLWKNNELTAKCIEHRKRWFWDRHVAPEENCKCGIYSARDHATLWRYASLSTEVPGFGTTGVAIVLLTLWGKIIPYELGYRAEHARIEGIFRPFCRSCAISGRFVTAKYYVQGDAFCERCGGLNTYRMSLPYAAQLEVFAGQHKLPLLDPI